MMWPLITQFLEFNYFNEYEWQNFVKKLEAKIAKFEKNQGPAEIELSIKP